MVTLLVTSHQTSQPASQDCHQDQNHCIRPEIIAIVSVEIDGQNSGNAYAVRNECNQDAEQVSAAATGQKVLAAVIPYSTDCTIHAKMQDALESSICGLQIRYL